MRAVGSPRGRDRGIARLAARQHGVVGREQLQTVGLRRDAIRRRLEAGRLHPVHHGVYAVGHRRLTLRGRWMAAVIACGSEALLSHRSATALWGIAVDSSTRTDVTSSRSRHPHPGIALHRSRSLHAEDRALRNGIPVTSVPRTLLDLAEVVQPQRLERAFEEADRLELLDLTAVSRLCERSHGRHGLRRLLPLLARTTPAPRTRSELERRFVDLVRGARIPDPICNATVHGFEVDALWPAEKVVVELQSYAYHRHRAAFERDHDRAIVLEGEGFRALRVTWRELEEQPTRVIAAVRRALEGATAARRSAAPRG